MSNRYINAVKAYSQATGTARLVLFLIADHTDDETGLAWPGDACLADEAATTDRNVRRIIQRLVDDGELEIADSGRGPGNYRKLRILLPLHSENRTASAGISEAENRTDSAQNRTRSAGIDDEKPDNFGQKTGQSGPENRTDSARKPDNFGTHTIYEPIEPLLEPREPARAHAMHPASNGKLYPVVLDDPPPRIPVSEKAGRKPRRRGQLTKFGIDPRRLVGGRIPEGQGTDPVEVFLEFNTVDKLNEPRADDMRRYVTDLERWRAVCRNWSLTYGDDWRKYGHMDWYLEDRRNGQAKASERNPVTANRTAARQSALGRQYEPGSPEWYEAKRKRGLL